MLGTVAISNNRAREKKVQNLQGESSTGFVPCRACRMFSMPIRCRIGEYSKGSAFLESGKSSSLVTRVPSSPPPIHGMGRCHISANCVQVLTPMGQDSSVRKMTASSPSDGGVRSITYLIDSGSFPCSLRRLIVRACVLCSKNLQKYG